MKKVVGNTEVEDSLQKLDKLTQEEARMAAAELIRITRSVDDGVQDVGKRVQDVEGRVQSVGERVEDKVQDVGNNVQDVNHKLDQANRSSCLHYSPFG